MEYPRMILHLQEIVKRAHGGNSRVRRMDIEAIKEALERWEEDIPNTKAQIGFHTGGGGPR